MHQRDNPCDRRGVSQGQRRAGDGRRVTGHPRAPLDHDIDSQVAVVSKPGIVSHRLASMQVRLLGISFGAVLRSFLAREAAPARRRDARRRPVDRPDVGSQFLFTDLRYRVDQGKIRGRGGRDRKSLKIQRPENPRNRRSRDLTSRGQRQGSKDTRRFEGGSRDLRRRRSMLQRSHEGGGGEGISSTGG